MHAAINIKFIKIHGTNKGEKKNLNSVSKYEILMKLFVLSQVPICCVNGDIIQAELVFSGLQFASISNILTHILKL